MLSILTAISQGRFILNIYIYIFKLYFYLEDIKYIFNNIKRAIFVYVIIYIYFKVKYTIVYPFIHMLFRAYINTMYIIVSMY